MKEVAVNRGTQLPTTVWTLPHAQSEFFRFARAVRFVECKLSDTTISPALLYLRRKFPGVEAVQVLARSGIDRAATEGVRLVSADKFLAELDA